MIVKINAKAVSSLLVDPVPEPTPTVTANAQWLAGLVAAPAMGNPDLGAALMPVVTMIQDLAFPIGLGMGIWGLIEFIMDNPAGKQKVKRAFIGYIGIFLLPTIFWKLKLAFATMQVGP